MALFDNLVGSYKCYSCGAKFRWQNELRMHIKKSRRCW